MTPPLTLRILVALVLAGAGVTAVAAWFDGGAASAAVFSGLLTAGVLALLAALVQELIPRGSLALALQGALCALLVRTAGALAAGWVLLQALGPLAQPAIVALAVALAVLVVLDALILIAPASAVRESIHA